MDASDNARYLHVATDGDGDAPTIRAAGELDAGSSPDLLDAVDAAAGPGAVVSLDLAEVTFIDSSGLRALAETLRRSAADGFELRIAAASEPVEHLLAMTGMASLLQP